MERGDGRVQVGLAGIIIADFSKNDGTRVELNARTSLQVELTRTERRLSAGLLSRFL